MTTTPNTPDEAPVVLAPFTMECGCSMTFDAEFGWFSPCSEAHRRIAQYNRQPGSMIMIGKVRA